MTYGTISNPFNSISGMGLINNFLYCIGNVAPSDAFHVNVSGGDVSVWATRIDINTPWSLSFSSNSSIKGISVKHSSLGIQQVICILIG